MAFRIRGSQGRAALGRRHVAQRRAVKCKSCNRPMWNFTPAGNGSRQRTGITYPVQWHVRAGSREFDFEPLLDDQENDTRLSTGAIYWEGAVQAYEQHNLVGRGYLELTGLGERLRLR